MRKKHDENVALNNPTTGIGLRFVSVRQKGVVIALPSGKGGVGKTTVALNLASALAIKGHRVIVLDMNLMLPNVHLFLTHSPEKTLTHYLAGDAECEDAIGYVELGKNKFDVIPAESIVDYMKRINIANLSRLIHEIKPEYDIIILDVAPGLTKYVIYPLKLSDQIFIVSSDTKPAYVDSMKVYRFVSGINARFRGCIVNMVSGSELRYFRHGDVFSVIPYDKKLEKTFRDGKTLFHSRLPAFISQTKKIFLKMADAISKTPRF